MRFDWYQATIEEDPSRALEVIAKLGHAAEPADGIARKHRYSQGWQINHNERGTVAVVLAGGNGDKPHAYATSDNTDAFVDLVRNEWPDRHLVTRMDAAEDFNDATAYDRLRRVALRVAKAHRLSFPSISDQLNPDAGRTQYIGSPSSDYRGRLYEKGLEQLAKHREWFAKAYPQFNPMPVERVTCEATGKSYRPEDWIRLEVQCRPDGEVARRAAAAATPQQAWGFTTWSHDLARQAFKLDLERVYYRQHKVSTDEQALRWMVKQYSGPLARLCADLGDWKAVGLQLGDMVAEQHRLRGRR